MPTLVIELISAVANSGQFMTSQKIEGGPWNMVIRSAAISFSAWAGSQRSTMAILPPLISAPISIADTPLTWNSGKMASDAICGSAAISACGSMPICLAAIVR